MIIPIFDKKYNMEKKNNVPLRTGAVSFENGTVFCFFPRTILFLSQTCYNNVQCARKKGLLLFDWACLQASGEAQLADRREPIWRKKAQKAFAGK